MDIEELVNRAIVIFDELTEEDQEAAARGIGLALGAFVKSTQTEIDDTLTANIALPFLQTLLDAVQSVLQETQA